MSLHKTRAGFVDWAKASGPLATIFGARIYDRFLPLLDLQSVDAMADQFPALVVTAARFDIDASLSTMTGLQSSQQVSFEVYGIIQDKRLYAPSPDTRAAAVTAMRSVDDAAAAVLTALVALNASCPLADWITGVKLHQALATGSEEDDFPAESAPGIRFIRTTINVTTTTGA